MGKHRSFIRHWRTFKGMTQKDVIGHLSEIKQRTSTREKFPATEASLSRIEAGDQNFNMALLAALAEVFDANDPRDLLTVNPFKGTLSVLAALEDLNEVQQEAALSVIQAMRSGGASPMSGE
jgi:transcriptional regulator with XRE-family HTH domain